MTELEGVCPWCGWRPSPHGAICYECYWVDRYLIMLDSIQPRQARKKLEVAAVQP
jgi:hypothetical protein